MGKSGSLESVFMAVSDDTHTIKTVVEFNTVVKCFMYDLINGVYAELLRYVLFLCILIYETFI